MKEFPKPIGLAVAGLSVISFIVVTMLALGEPRYHLIPLSQWVAKYCAYQADEDRYRGMWCVYNPVFQYRGPHPDELRAALQAMEPASRKYLIGLMGAPDNSPLFSQIRDRAKSSWDDTLLNTPLDLAPDRIRLFAGMILDDMEINGETMLPLINPWLNSTNAEMRSRGLDMLGCIRENAGLAEPALLRGLNDENQANQASALRSVGRLKLKSDPIIDWLIAAILKVDQDDRATIMEVLGDIGPRAKKALPTLVDLRQKEQNSLIKFTAALAICKIDRHEPEGLRGVSEALADDSIRYVALEQLRKLGINPATLPALDE